MDILDDKGRLAFTAYRATDGAYYVVGNLGYPKTLCVWMVIPHED